MIKLILIITSIFMLCQMPINAGQVFGCLRSNSNFVEPSYEMSHHNIPTVQDNISAHSSISELSETEELTDWNKAVNKRTVGSTVKISKSELVFRGDKTDPNIAFAGGFWPKNATAGDDFSLVEHQMGADSPYIPTTRSREYAVKVSNWGKQSGYAYSIEAYPENSVDLIASVGFHPKYSIEQEISIFQHIHNYQIIGATKVNNLGQEIGNFIPNPNWISGPIP